MRRISTALATISFATLTACTALQHQENVQLLTEDCGFYTEVIIRCNQDVMATINVGRKENLKCSDIVTEESITATALNNINYQKICLGRTSETLVVPK